MTDEHREEESLKAATDDETKPSKLDNKKLNTGNFPVEETEVPIYQALILILIFSVAVHYFIS